MENAYSWLIIFSGATIALLGTFLFAAERELRNIRREFDEFKRKQAAKPIRSSAESEPSETQPSAKTIATNEEHAKEIASLSSRLEESQRALAECQNEQGRLVSAENQQLQGEIANLRNQLQTSENQLRESTGRISATWQTEIAGLNQQLAERETAIEALQSAVQHAAKIESENQEICVENQCLREEIANYRSQLNRSEDRLEESRRRNEEFSDRCARLEEEVSDFKQQLEDHQSTAREIEAAQQQLANVESREVVYREQQEKLEVLIVDLERELSEGKNQVQALDETHQRLRETEHVCEELADENRRLGEEVSLWQERLAASEESQRQVSKLRQQLNELQTEHARLIDEKRHAQEDLAARGQPIAVSPMLLSEFNDAKAMQSTENPVGEVSLSSDLGKSSVAHIDEGMAAEIAILASRSLNNGSTGTGVDQMQVSSGDSAAAIPAQKEEEASWVAWTSVQRQWRVGAAVVIVVVIAGVFVMGFLGTRSSKSKELAVAPETKSGKYTDEPVSKPQTKPAPRLRGTFETVRATEVYRGPSENSPLIANIAPGMKLNVVNSSNGWLEVRSKYGRPPGFIREEAAVRIGQK
jgi:predicted RNase H-like nuclease (RuvC/YqgF family)